MKNKKIVINIDMKEKRVRSGFVKSNIKNKDDKSSKNISTENVESLNNISSKEKSKENCKEKNKKNPKKNITQKENSISSNIENKFSKEDTQKVEIEYINKKELKKISEGINIVNKYKKKNKKEREKRIGKTLKDVEEVKMQVYKEKENINLAPPILSFFLCFIIMALFVLVEYGPILGVSLKLNEDINSSKIDIVSSEGDFYSLYNEELLVYSNQVFVTYNKNGKKTWEYTLDQMFTPSIYIEGKYMVVANNVSGNIYLFENKKEILNKKVEGQIKNIYIDESGHLAIEYSSSGYKKIVGIYDKNGNSIYNTYLENDTIADIKLIDDASKFIVAKVNSSSFKCGVELLLVDSTKTEENIKTIAKLDNNLIYDMTIQDQNIIILLDNKLLSINMNTYETKEIKSFEFTQILYFTLGDNYYTCVEKELNNEDKYKICNVRFDGTVISELNIENSPKLVHTSKLLSYYIYQDKYSVVNKWGIEVENKDLPTIPKDIIVFNNEKSVALIYTNVIHIKNL